MIAEGLVGAPFVSSSDEIAKAQETFVRDVMPLLMAQVFDPDKEIMLSRFRRLSETAPEEALRFATEQGESKNVTEAVQ